MPWCDTCDAYQAPNSLKEDGTCATCGGDVDKADMKGGRAPDGGRAPWHFWLMIVVLLLYLGYRLVQGIVWAAGQV